MLILRLPAPFLGLACANSEQQKPKPREIWPKAKADNRAVTPSPAPCLSRWKADRSKLLGAEMAVSRQGLNRALHSSSCPAWKRTQSEARGHLKPEYDAVVIGAGKVKESRARAQGGKAAPDP